MRIPYLATCGLRYGGEAHDLLAGSIYAGTTRLPGACCTRGPVAARCRGCSTVAELYYIDPHALQRLDAALGAEARSTLHLEHGGAPIHAEAHLDPGPVGPAACRGDSGWLRLLLLLPPRLPPPTPPMGSYMVSVTGLAPCSDGLATCPAPGRARLAAADVYVSKRVLEEWLRSHGLSLQPAAGTLEPLGVTALLHAPTRPHEGGTA